MCPGVRAASVPVLGCQGLLGAAGGCQGTPHLLQPLFSLAAGAVQGREPGHRVRVRNAGTGAGAGEDPHQHQLGEGEPGDSAGLVPERDCYHTQLTLCPGHRPLSSRHGARPAGLSPKLPEPLAPRLGWTPTHSPPLLTPSSQPPAPNALPGPAGGPLLLLRGRGCCPRAGPGACMMGSEGGQGALGCWGDPLPSAAQDSAGPHGLLRGLGSIKAAWQHSPTVLDAGNRGHVRGYGACAGSVGLVWGTALGPGQEVPGTLWWAWGGGWGRRAPQAIRSLVLSGSRGLC